MYSCQCRCHHDVKTDPSYTCKSKCCPAKGLAIIRESIGEIETLQAKIESVTQSMKAALIAEEKAYEIIKALEARVTLMEDMICGGVHRFDSMKPDETCANCGTSR